MADGRKRGAPAELSSGRPQARARATHNARDVLKTLKAVAAIVVILSVVTATVVERFTPKTRQPVHEPRRLDWEEHVKDVRRRQLFRRMYRMEEDSFHKLAELLRPILERNDYYARMRTSNGAVPVKIRLAVALRMFAGASYIDVALLFGVAKETVFHIMWEVVDAINNTPTVGPFFFPQTVEECTRQAKEWEVKSTGGAFAGCVAAGDGLFVKTIAPAPKDTPNVLSFFSGNKSAYGLNVQATCDANYRFCSMSAIAAGSTNDWTAWNRSELSDSVARLPPGFYMLGDAAYPLSDQLLTPYAGKLLPRDEDAFNFFLSQLRVKIEQAFGILVGRWGILWRPLRVQFAGRSNLITALFRLHNYLCDEKVKPILVAEEDVDSRRDRPELSEQSTLPEEFQTATTTADKKKPTKAGDVATRMALRMMLDNKRQYRPLHNLQGNLVDGTFPSRSPAGASLLNCLPNWVTHSISSLKKKPDCAVTNRLPRARRSNLSLSPRHHSAALPRYRTKMSHKVCICRSRACREEGSDAGITVPKNPLLRSEWLEALGLMSSDSNGVRDSSRVSVVHFASSSLRAFKIKPGSADPPVVTSVPGCLPDQTDDDIRQAVRGAVGKYLKGEARVEKLAEQLRDEAIAREELRIENAELRATLDSLNLELREAKKKGRADLPGARSRDSIDHNILVGMDQAGCISLCGLPTHQALEKLYAAFNQHGVADNLVWYGTEERVSTDAPRAATFRRVNGLFFCLMVLRTGLPIVAVANLFGVQDTTGGRAFTTWVYFLSGALRPFVRLPEVPEILDPVTGNSTAPPNFRRQGFGTVTVVLDATELETVRVWQTDLAYYMFSPYKHRPTGKALVGVTARGAICYMSELYGGRISDTELVQRTGVIDKLSARGFGGHQGFTVMADKGFNGIGVQLLEAGMSMVVPPYARRGEEQFLQDDAAYTQEVANVRIHVERAIGALKEWKICANKFSSTRMDTVSKAFGVCAALVNMLNEPFVSTKP